MVALWRDHDGSFKLGVALLNAGLEKDEIAITMQIAAVGQHKLLARIGGVIHSLRPLAP